MSRQIVVVQGHPDPTERHLCHALADAYAQAATAAGHDVARIDVAQLDFPVLRSPAEFENAPAPPSLMEAQEALERAQHYVFVFPLWLGTLPALLKAFLEQIFRPGFAFDRRGSGFPHKRLRGRSARIVVTMGMPALIYRWFFGAHGVRFLERSVLGFSGLGPIRRTLFGGVGNAGEAQRQRWVERMREAGRRGD